MQNLKINPKTLWVFFLCAVIVFITQFNIYKPVIDYGLFIPEDFAFIVNYKAIDLNFFSKILYFWTSSGLHVSAEIFHAGILSDFLGANYSGYHVVNVILKAFATLSLFPLLLILFKNTRLAFFATVLFGISSAAGGSFLWVAKGSEFLGIAFLNIFLITYYYVILKNSKKLLFLSSLLFLTAYLMAAPRMYPQVLIIPLVEIYWLLKARKLNNLTRSLIRSVAYILPIVLVSVPAPVSPGYPFADRAKQLMGEIIGGNWHNLLDPLSSFGWTLFTNDFWKFFGELNMENFRGLSRYLSFLFKGPFFLFAIVSIFSALILSKKSFGRTYLLILGINFIGQVILFILASQYLSKAGNAASDGPDHFVFTKYPALAATYVFTLAAVSFWRWKKGRENSQELKENNLLHAIWAGPIFSLIFLIPTWVLLGPLINDWISVHWYFGIPAMGSAVFLGAVLALFYERMKDKKAFNHISLLAILLVIFLFYQTHKEAVAKQFMGINTEKVSLQYQRNLHDKLIGSIGPLYKEGDLLVYFEIPKESQAGKTALFYKEALVLKDLAFADLMHFRRGTTDGCIDAILEKQALIDAIGVQNDEMGFVYKGRCIFEDKDKKEGQFIVKKDNFYRVNNFYAFRIENGQFINIKEDLLKELGF